MCSERRSKKRQETNPAKKTKVDTDLNVIVLSISISLSRINNASDFLQQTSEAHLLFDEEVEGTIEIDKHNIPSDKNDDDNNAKALLYCMDENAESSKESTKFVLEIELDSELLNSVELDQDIETDLLELNKIKNSFIQLTKILILLLESGSKYRQRSDNQEIKRRSEARAAIQ
ncbi:4554_t:CDS:2 [Racocetra fulgida]|uniref:4554_t:CDS:1 n=1 Tax=Racocetra fulgida TaxID=60492 RepID=A0A9N8VI30_9GLOM|nr:4554_t:CDS:2 [Racocetra fulgida]